MFGLSDMFDDKHMTRGDARELPDACARDGIAPRMARYLHGWNPV
jgi:hypothetical protein